MVKAISLLTKADDLSHEEFKSYWENTHIPIVKEMPRLQRYLVSMRIDAEEGAYDGVAELYFDTVDDMEYAFSSPEGQRAVKDGEKFTSNVDRVITEERIALE
jgi:uncharacterized protein (TIGR02118 family)